jgi:hypothetical protein
VTDYYLCCGNKTGVAHPEEWVGIDLPQDVRTISRLENATRVFATPPCNGFTDLPWRPATGEGEDVLRACLRLCQESGAPWVLECNRWAQAYIGPAVCHRGGHYFWGPLASTVPEFTHRKMSTSGKDPLKRAALPVILP